MGLATVNESSTQAGKQYYTFYSTSANKTITSGGRDVCLPAIIRLDSGKHILLLIKIVKNHSKRNESAEVVEGNVSVE